MLLEEFPFLHLSEETLHQLWSKSCRQIEQLSKAALHVKRNKGRTQVIEYIIYIFDLVMFPFICFIALNAGILFQVGWDWG